MTFEQFKIAKASEWALLNIDPAGTSAIHVKELVPGSCDDNVHMALENLKSSVAQLDALMAENQWLQNDLNSSCTTVTQSTYDSIV